MQLKVSRNMLANRALVGFYIMNTYFSATWLLFLFNYFAEEEAAEVKKSKLYRPNTKFTSVSQNVSPAHSSEVRRPVSHHVNLLLYTR